MLEFLFHNKRPRIAVDIGSDSIKLLQLQQVGTVLSVAAYGRWRFPDGCGSDLNKRRELAVAGVRELLKTNKFRGRRAVSAINSSDMAIKNVRLPHMSAGELEQAVAWEAKDRFDFEVTADRLHFLNAGEVRQGTEVRDELILMAVPQKAVEEHLLTLDGMGLVAEHLDAEPVALFRAFERFLRRRGDEQAVSVIVDIGLATSRVIVSRGRQIVFVKSIETGGRRFTQLVASHLNLTYEEAAELREKLANAAAAQGREAASGETTRREENSLAWTVYDAMRGEVESLAREISLCLRYCSVTFRGLRCTGVTLTGGEAYDVAVQELLTQTLGMPCVAGMPLRGLDLSTMETGDRRGTLSEWAVCMGLALRDLVLPPAMKEGDGADDRLSA